MPNEPPNRLSDTRLDADLSVLGDDGHGGEPKIGRVGSAPEPEEKSGLQVLAEEKAGRDAGSAEAVESRRAEKEAIADAAAGSGKG